MQAIERKRMLMPVAAVKVFCHEPLASLDLAHSLNSAVIECGTLLGSSFSGVERHLWMNSAAKFQLRLNADKTVDYQKPMSR